MAGKITLDELLARATDPDVPEAELRAFFVGDKAQSRPFEPALSPNPGLVELTPGEEVRTQGAAAMGFANRIARRRRRNRFMRRRAEGDRRPVIVAEGDSWLQFPIFLEDVVDHVDDTYNVWCVSAAGDTLQNMVRTDPEYLDALRLQLGDGGVRRTVLLFSGAGNDFVGEDPDGESVIFKVLRPFQEGVSDPRAYLDTDAYRDRLEFIRGCYETLLRDVAAEFPGRVAAVVHGYDYSIPYRGKDAGDDRDPQWANKDGWLGQPLSRRGFQQPELREKIVKAMLDDLNGLLAEFAADSRKAGSRLAPTIHCDLRGTLKSTADWADELHPTNAGYASVSAKLAQGIETAFGSLD